MLDVPTTRVDVEVAVDENWTTEVVLGREVNVKTLSAPVRIRSALRPRDGNGDAELGDVRPEVVVERFGDFLRDADCGRSREPRSCVWAVERVHHAQSLLGP